MKYHALFLVTVLCSLTARAAAPDWIEDAADSRWLICGGESNGITIREKTGEGDMQPADGGLKCLRPDGGPGYIYLIAEPWEQFSAWRGDNDVLLTLRYFDEIGRAHV